MLYLSLFGHLSIARRDDSGVSKSVDLNGRPGNLLAYLALANGRFFTRTELIATLWPEQAEGTRIGTFNTTLWRLRKALERPPLGEPEIIVCDRRGAVGLKPNADLELDVKEFVQRVTPALTRPMEQLDDDDVRNLRRGVELYRDDILAGFTDDWALREREIHRRLHLNALARLMQLCVLGGDHAAAIRYAQSILDRDPLREDIHRELMRLFLVTGQRAIALRQFEICRASLRKELAIQPMRETMAVYQQIADSAVGRSSEPFTATPWPSHPLSQSWSGDPSPVDDVARRAARDLVANARRYLSQADAQLEQSLPYFDEPVTRLPPEKHT